MTVINTNTAAINAQYNLSKVQSAMDDAMSALSSGKRVTSAADDAAGLSIITRMESQVRGLNQAMKNAADGQNMIATAEGAMDEMTNMLQRMRELAIQASNDTMSDTDRKNLNAEVDQLISEIDRVVDTTRYNDIKLLDGSFSGSFQIGAKSGENMSISVGNLSSTALGTTMVGVASNAMISNEAKGTEAVTTISQLAFNGNDSYSFDVVVGVDGTPANNITLSVASTAMTAGNADDIGAALKAAVATAIGDGDLASGDIEVSVNSNVLTIKNNIGGLISVEGFTSTGSGTAQYQSVSGEGDNIQLGGSGAAVVDAQNGGGSTATGADGDLSLQQGHSYSFRVNGHLIEINNLDGGEEGDTSRNDVVTKIQAAVGENNDVSAALVDDDVTFTIANTDGQDISVTNFNAVSTPATSAGEMTLMMRVDANSSGDDNTFSNGGSDWSFLDGGDIAQLSFSADEANYSFDIDGETFTVKTELLDGSKNTLAEALISTKDAINAAAADGGALDGEVAARIVDGKLEIENLKSQLTGSKGTISFAVTTDDGDIHDTDESTAVTLNDGLDFNTVMNGDTVTLTFDEAKADYNFRLTGVNGSGALGADIPVSIRTESANKTLEEALAETATLLSSNSNLNVTSTATTLVIEYDAYAGNPTIKNELGQDLEASYTLNSDGSGDDTSITMNFTEAYADYSFDLTDTVLTDETFSVITSDGTGLAAAVSAVADAINDASTANDIVATAVGGQLTLTAANDTNITLENMLTKLGPLKIDNFSSTGTPHVNSLKIDNFSSNGRDAVDAGDVSTNGGPDIVATNDWTIEGTEAVASRSFLSVTGDDTYSFRLDSGLAGASAATITADVAGGDLSGLVNAINAQSADTGVTASEENGSITLTQADGHDITIDQFDSTGAGTIRVTHAADQASAGEGAGVILNDDASVEDADTAAAGLAVATTMSLEASGDDDISFKISDGTSIAEVRKTSWDADDGAAMLLEVNKALDAAGSNITAANVGGVITLTNASGGEIKITEFTSELSTTMTASPGTGQGVGKILDDTGLSGSGSALSSVNLASQEGADDALAIIDAAMENINSTRSELGAMSNRLDHTINNLGNVVVNTEASQSRIEDADFATETSNLTKAQILSQAATAMLAQANASKQSVLSLLQG